MCAQIAADRATARPRVHSRHAPDIARLGSQATLQEASVSSLLRLSFGRSSL